MVEDMERSGFLEKCMVFHAYGMNLLFCSIAGGNSNGDTHRTNRNDNRLIERRVESWTEVFLQASGSLIKFTWSLIECTPPIGSWVNEKMCTLCRRLGCTFGGWGSEGEQRNRADELRSIVIAAPLVQCRRDATRARRKSKKGHTFYGHNPQEVVQGRKLELKINEINADSLATVKTQMKHIPTGVKVVPVGNVDCSVSVNVRVDVKVITGSKIPPTTRTRTISNLNLKFKPARRVLRVSMSRVPTKFQRSGTANSQSDQGVGKLGTQKMRLDKARREVPIRSTVYTYYFSSWINRNLNAFGELKLYVVSFRDRMSLELYA
ncbi:hypothetical protein BDQ17DRAFT_1333809 [Cyathus striatus]|nr:hypothetical protein BDQ17DRAFT_1333809 [Cyathus striatus]